MDLESKNKELLDLLKKKKDYRKEYYATEKTHEDFVKYISNGVFKIDKQIKKIVHLSKADCCEHCKWGKPGHDCVVKCELLGIDNENSYKCDEFERR